MNPNFSSAPPPEVIPVNVQSFFVGGVEITLDSIGQSMTGKFVVDASRDFAVNAVIVSGYDQGGSLFELGVRTDLFKIMFKTDNSGLNWQSTAYDIRHFLELIRSGRFPGMYLAKGSQLEVTIIHTPVASNAAPVPPVTFNVSFFGSKTNLQRNPAYDAWVENERRAGRIR